MPNTAYIYFKRQQSFFFFFIGLKDKISFKRDASERHVLPVSIVNNLTRSFMKNESDNGNGRSKVLVSELVVAPNLSNVSHSTSTGFEPCDICDAGAML